MVPFSYRPLFSGRRKKKNIRLLTLLPGEIDSPIVCKLAHHSLKDVPSYEALSYCWGDQSVKTRITIDQENQPSWFEVTENLFSARLHLRRRSLPRTLWVDAICINQLDDDEKTSQIRLMRNIYENAAQVLIWLGPRADDSDRGLRLIERINIVRGLNEVQRRRANLWDLDEDHRGLPQSNDPAWFSLFKILQRPWFRRAWIVQEAAVAPRATFVCGTVTVDWASLIRALLYLIEAGGLGLTLGVVHLNQLVLLRHRRTFASDKRDKIFAFHGLFSRNGPGATINEPNCRLDPLTVYKDFAVKTLLYYQNLDLFSITRVQEISEIRGLPSWVPDWSVSDLAEPFLMRKMEGGFRVMLQPRHRASGESTYVPVFDRNKNQLRIQGYTFDRISATSMVLEPAMDHVSTNGWEVVKYSIHDQRLIRSFEMVARLHLFWTKYPTGEKIIDAYWQTLLAGCLWTGYDNTRRLFKMWYSQRRLFRLLQFLSLDRMWFIMFLLSIEGYICMIARLFTSHNPVGLFYSKDINPFQVMANSMGNRRMVRTKKGFIGLGPHLCQPSDFIAICKGGKLPLVLRPKGNCWELIGECYIHGVMDGTQWEALSEQECLDFWLV